MIVFLVKSTLCLILLYAFYLFFLEKRKMHRFNRFYLLGILLFSFLVPNLILYLESHITSPINTFSEATAGTFNMGDYTNFVFGIYLFVAFIYLLRFIGNVISIFRKINQNQQIKRDNVVLVLLKEKILPHTFLHYVFINKADYESQKIEKELFTHELTHAIEKHTMDVLFIELFQLIFWFNPVVSLIKKSIRLNHEFIADETVINTHKNTSEYQYILLDISTLHNNYGLTSSLNYSLTKKRFQMMTKKSSLLSKRVAKLSMIPLLLSFIFLFANMVVSQEHNDDEHKIESPATRNDNDHHDTEKPEHNSIEEREHS